MKTNESNASKDDCGLEQTCTKCGQEVKLNLLREHYEECTDKNHSPTYDDTEHLQTPSVAVPRCQTMGQSPVCTNDNQGVRPETPGSSASCYNSYIELLSDSENDDEDVELAAAIQASLQDSQPITNAREDNRENKDDVKRILCNLASLQSTEDPVTIIIRRNKLLASTKKAVNTRPFSFWTPIQVIFSGEEAVDDGVPSREYFNLLMKEVNSSGIFQNCGGKLTFKYDLQLLSQKAYEMGGRFVTWSLTNGGPGLCSLCPSVFAAMVGQPVDITDVQYLPDMTSRSNIEKLLSATQEDFLATIAEVSEWLIDQGINNVFCINFGNRDSLVKELLSHQIYYRVQSCITQFTKGLGPLWDEVKQHPEATACLFVYDDNPLQLGSFRKLYKVDYSLEGSNNRSAEEDTLYCFEVFLQNCEDKKVDVTLEEVLHFWTGTEKPPPGGFKVDPLVSFYTDEKRLPSSNTCGPVLWLPRGKEDLEDVQSIMSFALKGTMGFGKI